VDDGINDQSLYQIFYLEYIHLRCSAEIINLTLCMYHFPGCPSNTCDTRK
jgi:hypothetical protein